MKKKENITKHTMIDINKFSFSQSFEVFDCLTQELSDKFDLFMP